MATLSEVVKRMTEDIRNGTLPGDTVLTADWVTYNYDATSRGAVTALDKLVEAKLVLRTRRTGDMRVNPDPPEVVVRPAYRLRRDATKLMQADIDEGRLHTHTPLDVRYIARQYGTSEATAAHVLRALIESGRITPERGLHYPIVNTEVEPSALTAPEQVAQKAATKTPSVDL